MYQHLIWEFLTPNWGVIKQLILRLKPILKCHTVTNSLHWHWRYFPVRRIISVLLTVLKKCSIPGGFRKVKTCGPCRADQYSSAKPTLCVDPLFPVWPSFQLLLKKKNYSRRKSFLPKSHPSERFILDNLSYMRTLATKAACQVSYSSNFPCIPRPLLRFVLL